MLNRGFHESLSHVTDSRRVLACPWGRRGRPARTVRRTGVETAWRHPLEWGYLNGIVDFMKNPILNWMISGDIPMKKGHLHFWLPMLN